MTAFSGVEFVALARVRTTFITIPVSTHARQGTDKEPYDARSTAQSPWTPAPWVPILGRMPSKSGSVKTAYDFDPKVKHKLAMLKADLRLRGIAASETGIVEVLVSEAKLESLARLYRRYLGI